MKTVVRCWQIFLLALLLLPFSALVQAQTRCASWAAKLESLEGEATFLPKGSEQWQAVQVGTTFCYGDSLRITEFRAALRLENDSLVRLQEGSVVKFVPPKKSYWLELLEGAAHFISRTPKNFTVKAPYMNAAVEGTEFLLSHTPEGDTIAVFEGKVKASNSLGSTRLGSMQQSQASADNAPTLGTPIVLQNSVNWALHYPPIFYPEALLADNIRATLKAGEYAETLRLINNNPAIKDSLLGQNLQTAIALYRGRVDQAKASNKRALNIDVNSPDAQALAAIMNLVEGNAQAALRKTTQLAQSYPSNARVLLAHSYSLQAAFKLDTALQAARQGLALLPNEVLLQLRVAELALSIDKRRLAKNTLNKIKTDNEELSSQRGALRAFISLQSHHNRRARNILQRAIAKESSNPLTQFAFGLAKIRLGNLQAGRQHIELAVILDPSNSLYRSYLGKAYAEEGRSQEAKDQFTLAKTLDPKDPTPWFYQGLEQQSNNQLIGALESIDISQSLNDGRAVYRSRFLLDKDNASRSASQGRIYNTLGFEQQAIQVGASATQDAPQEHSGHRLLAEIYANNNRFESLRASERLQATLLQPINAEPLPLGLAESGLLIVDGTGPANLGLNEYNPLFVEEGLRARATGLAGSRDTRAYDINLGGHWEQFTIGLGHYQYKTDGFRANNDVDYKISNALVQWQPLANFSIQAEVSRREEEEGDLGSRFDLSDFSETKRENAEIDTYRLGTIINLPANSKILISGIKKDKTQEAAETVITPSNNNGEGFLSSSADIDQYELQYFFQIGEATFLTGYSYGAFENKSINLDKFPPIPEFGLSGSLDETQFFNDDVARESYFYSFITLFDQKLDLTLGATYSDNIQSIKQINNFSFDDSDVTFRTETGKIEADADNYFLPKIGITWQALKALTFRTAYAETYSRNPDTQLQLSPTHINGFTQLFDYDTGIETSFRAFAADLKVNNAIAGGVSFIDRDLTQPQVSFDQFVERELDNSEIILYINYTINKRLAVSLTSAREKYERKPEALVPDTVIPLEVKTRLTELTINYKLNKFFSFNVTANDIDQSFLTEADPFFLKPAIKDSENVQILDANIKYQFKKQLGIVKLEVKNLFDKEFDYADFNIFTSAPRLQPFTPERSIYLNIDFKI